MKQRSTNNMKKSTLNDADLLQYIKTNVFIDIFIDQTFHIFIYARNSQRETPAASPKRLGMM